MNDIVWKSFFSNHLKVILNVHTLSKTKKYRLKMNKFQTWGLRAILLIIVYTDMSYIVGPNADIKDPLPVLIQTPSSRGWGML